MPGRRAEVVIAGFGRMGADRRSPAAGPGGPSPRWTPDPEQVDVVRKFGLKVFYGDAAT